MESATRILTISEIVQVLRCSKVQVHKALAAGFKACPNSPMSVWDVGAHSEGLSRTKAGDHIHGDVEACMATIESPEIANTASALGDKMGRVFLTVNEAADRRGAKSSWICERTRHNRIPHRRLGESVRFTEQDIRAIADATAIGDLH